MKDAKECIRGALLVSAAFLFIFTSYNAIENLETSIIRGECQNCMEGVLDGICQAGNTCQNKVQFSCDLACEAPFAECTSSLGSTILGVVYLTFTMSAFLGPVIPNMLGLKKSMFSSGLVYALFAFANLIVALHPTNQNLHWAIMIPIAALEGVAASVLWIAQATYLTKVSVLYSKFQNEPIVSSMGLFNGMFFSIFRMSAICGNMISSLVLGYFLWSSESLFVMYTLLGVAGASIMLTLPTVPVADHEELTQLVESGQEATKKEGFSFQGLWSLAKDSRMLILVPVFVLNGLQQGFATGEFTSNVIRESLGSASIGYVMALFGATNVVASYGFGKLADRCGPLGGQLMGFASMLTAFSLCYWIPFAKCDSQWTLILAIAILLSLGDAFVLGQEFSSDAVNAFSIFKVYQSASVSASFFLFHYLSFQGRLVVLISMVLLATASYLVYSKKFRRVVSS